MEATDLRASCPWVSTAEPLLHYVQGQATKASSSNQQVTPTTRDNKQDWVALKSPGIHIEPGAPPEDMLLMAPGPLKGWAAREVCALGSTGHLRTHLHTQKNNTLEELLPQLM